MTHFRDAAPPASASEDDSDQRRRILTAAQQIIRETGTFDLPMRALSARAKVSMTRPYSIFGSKSGVVAAILAQNEARWRRERAAVESRDLIEEHFDSLRLGMNFYASDQPFYRALFRLTADRASGGEDYTRLNHQVFRQRMRAAHAEGLLRATADPDVVAEVLTDLFSAGVRAWAINDWDVERLYARLGYGYALALAGAGNPEVTARMIERSLSFQRLQAGPTGA